jgi:uncharacterized membrane protein
MFKGDTWIFAAADPAVVGIDLATDMKCALNTSQDLTPLDSLTIAIQVILCIFCYIITVQNTVHVL